MTREEMIKRLRYGPLTIAQQHEIADILEGKGQFGCTEQMAKLLTFLRDYSAAKGFSPSLEEMRVHLGISSKSGAHRILIALEERGLIERLKARARAIRLVGIAA